MYLQLDQVKCLAKGWMREVRFMARAAFLPSPLCPDPLCSHQVSCLMVTGALFMEYDIRMVQLITHFCLVLKFMHEAVPVLPLCILHVQLISKPCHKSWEIEQWEQSYGGR
jgi:hypothetical protein